MPENRFIRQVRAAVHGIGKYRVHNSLVDIAETLLERWPEEHYSSDVAIHARLICMECLADTTRPAEDARDAFILAADAAGISIMLEDLQPRYRVPPAAATAQSTRSRQRDHSADP